MQSVFHNKKRNWCGNSNKNLKYNKLIYNKQKSLVKNLTGNMQKFVCHAEEKQKPPKMRGPYFTSSKTSIKKALINVYIIVFMPISPNSIKFMQF